ncbi:hypothetical protein Q8G35_23530 [Peribacillus simplex]|uniref:Uncharacterized protein n=2 Tax=Peribacillus TaxID=2675229 RepID=A0AA90PBY7_9BACI|nr:MULTISPECIES: hypothetical protein [Peribacillus]MDP1421263.1 hypothetical protein [Peribacillus simplex]MDP1452958.1 hypothetical protein [Peribacillus frigoritolerans]
MKKILQLLLLIPVAAISIFIIILIAGQFGFYNFIGEDYDTSPPTGELHVNGSGIIMEQGNVNWEVKDGEFVKKRVDDIKTFAQKEKKIDLPSGEDIGFSYIANGTVLESDITAQLWNNNKKELITIENSTIHLPNRKGTFILEINLVAEQGTVQYISTVNLN